MYVILQSLLCVDMTSGSNIFYFIQYLCGIFANALNEYDFFAKAKLQQNEHF